MDHQDHLRPFHRLESLRTRDDKEAQPGIQEMEGVSHVLPDLGPDPELSYDERVVIVSPRCSNPKLLELSYHC